MVVVRRCERDLRGNGAFAENGCDAEGVETVTSPEGEVRLMCPEHAIEGRRLNHLALCIALGDPNARQQLAWINASPGRDEYGRRVATLPGADALDTSRLRALREGITLPWKAQPTIVDGDEVECSALVLCPNGEDGGTDTVAEIDMGHDVECDDAHAALIVGAVNHLGPLCDEVDKLRKALVQGQGAPASAPLSYVTEQGVVRLPDFVREHLGVKGGGGVVFHRVGEARVEITNNATFLAALDEPASSVKPIATSAGDRFRASGARTHVADLEREVRRLSDEAEARAEAVGAPFEATGAKQMRERAALSIALAAQSVGEPLPGETASQFAARRLRGAAEVLRDLPLLDSETQGVASADAEVTALRVRLAAVTKELNRLRWGVVANAGRCSRERMVRWGHVVGATSFGSTSSIELCIAAGFNPDEVIGIEDDEEGGEGEDDDAPAFGGEVRSAEEEGERQTWQVEHGPVDARVTEKFIVTRRGDAWQATQPHADPGFFWGDTPFDAVAGWASLAKWTAPVAARIEGAEGHEATP